MVKELKAIEYAAIFFVMLVFSLAVGKYYYPNFRVALSEKKADSAFAENNMERHEKSTTEHDLLFQYDKASNEWKVKNKNGERNVNFTISKGATDNVVLEKKTSQEDDSSSLVAQVEGVHTYFSNFDGVLETEIPFSSVNKKTFRSFEQEDVVPIMGYHFILPDGQEVMHPSLEMTQSDFREQAKFMTQELGCRWFTLGEVMNDYVGMNKKIPRGACVMNFDDGRENNYNLALPVMEEFDIKATFFIITKRIDTISYMSWDQIDDLYRRGHEIGSHSVDSGDLVEAFNSGGVWADEELKHQLENSLETLRKRGYKTTTFAYPRGEWNDAVVDAVESAGYSAARNIGKKETWRDLRALTVGSDDLRWHMHYIKPEGMDNEMLRQTFAYDGWWQFEEGVNSTEDIRYNGLVKLSSNANPTKRSFAIVGMDRGAEISNKFSVGLSGEYNIEFLGAISRAADQKKVSVDSAVGVFVDGRIVDPQLVDGKTCVTGGIWNYCVYGMSLDLTKGEHVITMKANSEQVMLDKFRVYRDLPVQEEYIVKVVETKSY